MFKKKHLIVLLFIINLISAWIIIPFSYADVEIDFYVSGTTTALGIKDKHPSDSGSASESGQSFTCSGGSYEITSVTFKLRKVGSPTGTAYAVLYAHSGEYGVSSVPTGSALATSDGFDVSQLTGTGVEWSFTFSGGEQYAMTQDAYYCISFQSPSSGTYDSSNYVHFYVDLSGGTHDGNHHYFLNGAYSSYSFDSHFRVYGNLVAPPIYPPSEPDLLFGAGFNSSFPYVELHWNHSLERVNIFEIQNSSDSISWDYLGQSTTTNYTDNQIVNGTYRYYKVRACNYTNPDWYNSSYSNIDLEKVYFIPEVGTVSPSEEYAGLLIVGLILGLVLGIGVSRS